MGIRQVQVNPESQPVSEGTDEKGVQPGTGMAMVQAETATVWLRQVLRATGAHGQEVWEL